jgi:hypothetical protein
MSAAMNWPNQMPDQPFGREIDQLLACGDLDPDLGMGLAEGYDQRLRRLIRDDERCQSAVGGVTDSRRAA